VKRILLVVLITWCFVAGAVSSEQMDEAQMAAALDQLGQLLGLAPVEPAELSRKVEEIGELRFRHTVPIDFMSREELKQYIRELFDEEYPVEFAEREERALRGFGFLEDGQDLRTIREKVLNENIAGFYDERPGVKKLFAISSGRTLGVMNQLILSHELRHAVQDQHVVIREKLIVDSDYDDRRLAALCLFEGDASVLMEQYLMSGVTENMPEMANLFQVLDQGLSGADIAEMLGVGPALKTAPPIVQEQLIAPYVQGRALAMAAYKKGGFALLNELMERPPRSMEQVLHPEKYLGGPGSSDEPVPVKLSETRDAEVDFEGRLGEFLIQVLLRGGPARAQANAAAAGWGGDAFAVLRTSEGFRLVWRSVWDSVEDAREFESALVTHMDGSIGNAFYELESSGKEVLFVRSQFR